MKKALLVLPMLMMLSFGVKAEPATAVFSIIQAGFGALVATDKGQACDNEPLRKVAWKDNPNGYSFVVAGCDYQAKKDKLVLK